MKQFNPVLCFVICLGIVFGLGAASPQDDRDIRIDLLQQEIDRLKAEKDEAPKVEASTEFREVKAGDKFHLNVVRAAKKKWQAGELKWRDYRKIRFYMSVPGFRKQAEKMAIVQMKTSDDPESDAFIERFDFSNIDWDALLSFIERLIPLILNLIDALA